MTTLMAKSFPAEPNAATRRSSSARRQTEAGSIPSDWKLEPIEQIALITTGGRNTQDRVSDGEFPFFVRSQVVERINTYSYDGEAVLTAGDGVGTGKVFHYINGKFDAHQRVYRISDFRSDVSGYFFYLYFSNNFYSRIMQMTAKSSVDSVRREMISRMLIPLPPTLAEQQAIAEALSDADALIEGLESVIAKKRAIKQGAMQDLLTGKRRLPGFEGEWERYPLLQTVSLPTGQVDPKRDPYRSMPLVGPEHIEGATGRLSEVRTAAEQGAISGKYVFSAGDLIYGKINPHLKKVTLARFDGICSADLYPLRPAAGFNASFLLGVLLGDDFTKYAVSLSARSGIPKINRDELSGYFVFAPKEPEQSAIAAVLSDMDAEIEALDGKLTKARAVKQGMMQELLTGRVRLV